MIKYNLKCGRDHGFEGWFGSSDDYDDQARSGLLVCPECGSKSVEKAIMAPAVRRGAKTPDKSDAIAAAIRSEIAENCDNVGSNFTAEARAMHTGERPPRGIYGQATPEQAKAMADEGIPVLPLPDVLDPKRAKKNLN